MGDSTRWVKWMVFAAGFAIVVGALSVAARQSDSAGTAVGASAAVAGLGGPSTTITSSTLPPETTLASQVAEAVVQIRAEADRYAAGGKEELARQWRADADSLEKMAPSGNLAGPTVAGLTALLDAMRAAAPSVRFDPEGQWICEGPLISNDLATNGWCWIYPDETRGVADIIAVGPSEVLVLGIGSPRSPEFDAIVARGLEMILTDPSKAGEAVALVDAARGDGAGQAPRRVVATFSAPIDVTRASISTHRQGNGYVLVVNGQTIEISPTWP